MAARIKDLTLEQLDELIRTLDQHISSMCQFRALEQQMTGRADTDLRLSAIINSMEAQRRVYNRLRARRIIGGPTGQSENP